jgi:acyl-CoA synthetase (AMP-forming)/AMP-acid ligase II
MTTRHESLVDLLRRRAIDQADQTAFTFLRNGETPSETVTWRQLDERSRAVAFALRPLISAGDRVLVAYPSGLEFLAGFFGCLYASAIAVPVQVPRTDRQTAAAARFLSIAADAGAAIVLTHSSVAGAIEDLLHGRTGPTPREIPTLLVLSTDDLRTNPGHDSPACAIDTNAVAFLQYTSGSTSLPRGVMVTHANLLHNLAAAFAFSPETVAASVSWLPFTHDMGLIEGLLQPVFRGHHAVLLAPSAFLQRPVRWLRAISTYRAARSGGPNFAYDLCTRRVADDDLRTLDLSCWLDAYNGAEPVRHETLTAFALRFGAAGFRPQAFRPCYGLAEATLIVACGYWRPGPTGSVACGTPAPDTTIAIVDPADGGRCQTGQVGEIWVAGPGVAPGYWGRKEQSAHTFGARLLNDAREYLRTGDLGFMAADGLHVTGRIKDVLIVRGQKHFPADLEMTAAQAHPAATPFGVAAFAAGADVEGDHIVVALEVDRRWSVTGEPHRAMVEAIRSAVATSHGVLLEDVVLLPPRALPRTTSGKVQRFLCRDRWRQGRLKPVEAAAVS